MDNRNSLILLSDDYSFNPDLVLNASGFLFGGFQVQLYLAIFK